MELLLVYGHRDLALTKLLMPPACPVEWQGERFCICTHKLWCFYFVHITYYEWTSVKKQNLGIDTLIVWGAMIVTLIAKDGKCDVKDLGETVKK